MFKKISKKTGISIETLKKEMKTRAALLIKMQQQNIRDYKEFNDLVNQYYKDKDKILKRFGL